MCASMSLGQYSSSETLMAGVQAMTDQPGFLHSTTDEDLERELLVSWMVSKHTFMCSVLFA